MPINAPRRQAALAAIMAKFPEITEVDGIVRGAFYLVETNRSEGVDCVTGHPSPLEAIAYHVEQECAEDWRVVGLYDARGGCWLAGTFSHTVTIDVPAP